MVGTQYVMAIIHSADTPLTMKNPANSASHVGVQALGFTGVVSAGSYALPSTQAISGITWQSFCWWGAMNLNTGYAAGV